MATNVIIILNIFVHFIIPLTLLAWVAFSRATSRLYWVMIVLTVVPTLLILQVIGAGWAWFGFWWPSLFWALFVGALFYFVRRRWTALPSFPPKKLKPWIGIVVTASVALFMISGLPSFLELRTYEGDAINLQWPLAERASFVAHGGGTEFTNHHHRVVAQRYALDVLQLNGFGTRARGLVPADLNAYEVWNAPITAPCDAEVLDTRDGLADQKPMEMDPDHIMGNYVTLFCDNATILIAHLQKDSVAVDIGDRVRPGDAIGKVGNTGNTSEPHLHIHAVRGRVTDLEELASTGEPVPMLFDGQFFVRNDRVRGQ